MKVKYYGTRGSLPVPGKDTIKYGGNTACVRINNGSTLIIMDAGTGLRKLGNELMETEFAQGKGVAHIFFSHAHWDHISGFPFFAPAYIKGNRFFLYGCHNPDSPLRQILSRQQNWINFPVSLEEMASHIEFIDLQAGQKIKCATINISCFALNHPAGAFSYACSVSGKKVVYASDYEHEAEFDLKLADFAGEADLLIYDAMFTPEEYQFKKGWGHSTYLEGIKIANSAGIKQLHLFHYNPEHSDQHIDEIERLAQKLFPQTFASKEGWEIEI